MCSLFFSSIIINDQSNFCKMLSLILISWGFIWEYSIFEWWAVEVIGTHMQLIERFEFLFTLCIELDGRKKRRRHQKNRLNIELFGIWGGREREREWIFSTSHADPYLHTTLAIINYPNSQFQLQKMIEFRVVYNSRNCFRILLYALFHMFEPIFFAPSLFRSCMCELMCVYVFVWM